jgi:transaldolase/glucose-6-phosphate isomerase
MENSKITRLTNINFFLGEYRVDVDRLVYDWKKSKYLFRLWERDTSLWSSKPEEEITDRLGWLELPEKIDKEAAEISTFVNAVREDNIQNVILLGMGGSSLGPEMFSKFFGKKPGYPELIVLDSTHPAAVMAVENRIDIKQSLFLVSSKSGTTLETISFFQYFWEKVTKITSQPGDHFAAITDPGSPLVSLAEKKNFRSVFLASPDVGGRFSAFSCFGLLPAALIGIDLEELKSQALSVTKKASAGGDEEKSDSLKLGAVLGEIGRNRDKITFFVSPSLLSFVDWLEQLIAESLGKSGKGIIPIINEIELPVKNYRPERLFVFLYDDIDIEHPKSFENKLREASHPVISINVNSKYEIGREIFRWEMAVAAAGSVLRVNPFNQPDVQLTKALTGEFMSKKKGSAEKNGEIHEEYEIGYPGSLRPVLDNWLNMAQPAAYIAIQAYLAPYVKVSNGIEKIRKKLLEKTLLATTLGFGPRFLHSTGQLHKGGPKTGLFLQLVDEPERDLSVPGEDYTFGSLIKAQSAGDFLALKQRNRHVLRINLGKNVLSGLNQLAEIIG